MVLRGLTGTPLPNGLRSFESIKVPPVFEVKTVGIPVIAETSASVWDADVSLLDTSSDSSLNHPETPSSKPEDIWEQLESDGQKYLDPTIVSSSFMPPQHRLICYG